MKRFLLIVVTLFIVGIGALVAFLATLDVNQYKPRIIAAIQESTQRAFDIKGDIALKPSLIPTLSVEGVSFGNADWAVHDTMATAERFEARIKLLPLLSGQIAIRRVVLIGARVVLETDRKGRGNWVLALEDESDEPADETELPAFDLQEITIEDALFEYRPYEAEATSLTVDHLDITTTGLGKPLSVRLDARYNDIAFLLGGELAPLERLLGNEPYDIVLKLSLGDLAVTVAGSIAEPLTPAGLALGFELAMPSTAALSSLVEGDLPTIEPVSVSGDLSGGGGDYVIENLQAILGPSDLSGRIDLNVEDERPEIEMQIESKLIDVSAFESAPAPAQTGRDRVFSADPLPLDALKGFDASARIAIGQLKSTKATVESVRGNLKLKGGKLSIKDFEALLTGGTVAAEVILDASRKTPRFVKTATVKGMALGAFLNGTDGDFASGGTADVDFQIAGQGVSLAEIMGSSDGHIRIDVGNLQIANKAAGIASADMFTKAFDILNPLSKSDDKTVIECAVVNFPINGGLMQSKTGIGVSTRKLNILGGGSVDFKSEQIDIGVNPKPREGVGLNVSSLAKFVRLGGTMANPKPTTDAMGAASAGLKVSTALATGGLSLLADGLLDRATSDVNVCAIARGDEPPPTAVKTAEKSASKVKSVAGQAAETTTDVLKGAGSKVKGVFKGLFGD